MSQSIDETLKQRGEVHGDYALNSLFAQALKHTARTSPNYQSLPTTHKEALDMILHKIARILSGDPNHADHWHDIQGYARLAEQEILKIQRRQESVSSPGADGRHS
jgi:hypothetical protein